MKSLLLTLVLVISTQVNAAQVELGKYKAVDVNTKAIHADLVLRADATTSITINTPDLPKPIPCEGTYTLVGNEFSANVKCKSTLLDRANVKIDVTNVNPQSVRTEAGAEVSVVIDALGDDAMKFMLKKAD
ncbi:MAG: hypothetical protein AABY53_05815 [Bdellovibrionota bacterium]